MNNGKVHVGATKWKGPKFQLKRMQENGNRVLSIRIMCDITIRHFLAFQWLWNAFEKVYCRIPFTWKCVVYLFNLLPFSVVATSNAHHIPLYFPIDSVDCYVSVISLFFNDSSHSLCAFAFCVFHSFWYSFHFFYTRFMCVRACFAFSFIRFSFFLRLQPFLFVFLGR